MPNGIAWYQNTLWIAALKPGVFGRLYRVDNVDAIALANRAAKPEEVVLVRDDLPSAFMHGWKYLRFDKNGNLYVPIGADDNIALMNGTGRDGILNDKVTPHVTNPYQKNASTPVFYYSSIYKFGPYPPTAATVPEWVAFGVRNTVGFDFHPVTGDLFFTDNGRDNIGGPNMADPVQGTITSNAPDCELNYAGSTSGKLPAPRYFGYPYCHTGPAGDVQASAPFLRPAGIGKDIVDPDTNANETAVKCSGPGIVHTSAVQAFGPHIAPLGMRFGKTVTNGNFPTEYTGPDVIYAAHHGSWNRPKGLIGARVMLVKLANRGTSAGSSAQRRLELRDGMPLDERQLAGRARPVRRTTTKRQRGLALRTTSKRIVRTTSKKVEEKSKTKTTTTTTALAKPTQGSVIDTPFGIKVMDPSLVVPPKVSSYQAFFAGGVPGDTGLLPDGPNPPVIGSGSLFNGRPVDMEWLPDGSMLISDDQKNRVLRIAYCGTGRFPASSTRLGMGRCGGVLAHGTTGDSSGVRQSTRSAALWNGGCTVNLDGIGASKGTKAYRRCIEWDVTGLGNYVTLAFTLVTDPRSSSRYIVDAALVTLDYEGTNGKGWVGLAMGKLAGAAVAKREDDDEGEGGGEVDSMVGLNSIIAKPSSAAPSGAVVNDLQLGSSTCSRPVASCFTATTGYLAAGTSPSAGVAGRALVQTFSLVLSAANLKTVSAFIGLGDVDASTGALKQHWKLAKVSLPFQSSDVGAEPVQGTMVINPGLSWAAANSGGSTPAAYPTAPPCVFKGETFDSCTTLTDAGASMTFFYSSNATDSTTLRVAIRAAVNGLGGSSKGWIAWGFNPSSPGSMIGTITAFARYSASAPGGATSAVFRLGGYATGAFTVPSPSPFSDLTASSDTDGTGTYLNLRFTLPWSLAGQGGFLANYAAGAYNGGSATGADGMAAHVGVPPKACIRGAGMGPVSPCGGCA
ncbi:hypothetical protein DFJ74DRAFT_421641 [Hyaloraphidium curvatum]|nr:hypothetical protein DFJ74DRAFT_421641 [Hyaloraphidium curvatum]